MVLMTDVSFNSMYITRSPRCVLRPDTRERGFFPGMMPDTPFLCLVMIGGGADREWVERVSS